MKDLKYSLGLFSTVIYSLLSLCYCQQDLHMMTEPPSSDAPPPPSDSASLESRRIKAIVVKGDTGPTKACLNDSRVTAVWFSYSWAQLEPTDGDYKFAEVIDNDPAVLGYLNAGKKLVLKFVTAEDSAIDQYVSPQWLFTDKGVPMVHQPGTSIWPVYSNSTFQSYYKRFVQALAAHYDGNPNILFWRANGFNNATEPTLDAAGDKYRALWAAYGYEDTVKGLYYPGGQFHADQVNMIKIWLDAFKTTPLAMTIHFPLANSFEDQMNSAIHQDVINEVIRRGNTSVIFTNNGLNYKASKPKVSSRTLFASYYQQGLDAGIPIQVGWTSLTSSDATALPLDVAREATGSSIPPATGEHDFTPEARTSVSVVGDIFCGTSNRTDVSSNDVNAGFDWLNTHLVY